MMKKIIRSIISLFTYFGLSGIIKLIELIPERLMRSFGSLLSKIYYFLAIKNRKLAIRNVRLALSDSVSEKDMQNIVRQSFKTMGQAVMDTIYFRKVSSNEISKSIAVEGLENLKKAFESGRGVIVVSAHFGTFSMVGVRLTIAGYCSNLIARRMRDKKLEKIFVKICRAAGQKVIFNKPIVTFFRRCTKALLNNELIILMVDQNFGTDGVPVNFFNRQAMVPMGPVGLSMRTGSPLLPVFLVKEKNNQYVLKIEPVITISSTGNNELDTKIGSQAVVDVIERYIRKYPGQWVNWIHKRWDA